MKALILNLKKKDVVILYTTKEELEEKLKPFVEKNEGSFDTRSMGLEVI